MINTPSPLTNPSPVVRGEGDRVGGRASDLLTRLIPNPSPLVGRARRNEKRAQLGRWGRGHEGNVRRREGEGDVNGTVGRRTVCGRWRTAGHLARTPPIPKTLLASWKTQKKRHNPLGRSCL